MIGVPLEPVYSRQWCGRRFRLAEGSLRWGRYEIVDEKIGQNWAEFMPGLQAEFGQLDPGRLAATFENLIHIYIPEVLPTYLFETDALATLEYSRAHLAALEAPNCRVDELLLGRVAVASSFRRALTVVFEAAKPLHGLTDCVLVKYRRARHGMHVAELFQSNVVYQAAFSPDLVLECIDEVGNMSRVWSSRIRGNS